MGHKVLIGGTSYEIKGGKTLINGTAYSITKGRTLIDGTGYDINFSNVSSILNDNNWATIREVSDAGTGANYWSVGDTKNIIINGTVGNTTFSNLSVDAFILGFNHNSSREGNNRIHFQIGKIGGVPVALVDAQYGNDVSSTGYFSMNSSATNAGGWASSQMRNSVIGTSKAVGGRLTTALSAELQAVLKTCTKYSDNTGGGVDSASYVTSTTEYLFLLSEFEYHGARSFANSTEQNYQQQYSYYQAGNSKVKYKYNAISTASSACCRSVRVAFDYVFWFCAFSPDGSVGSSSPIYSRGISPAFCV